jgi:hypothetical protein
MPTDDAAAAPPREVDEGSPVVDSGIQTMLSSQFGPAIQKFYSDHEKLHQEMINNQNHHSASAFSVCDVKHF